jgi:sugar phosphate isomerase/epimerase
LQFRCRIAGPTEHECLQIFAFRGAGAVELPAPGLEILNYDPYLQSLAKIHPHIPLVIEHLDEAEIPRAK